MSTRGRVRLHRDWRCKVARILHEGTYVASTLIASAVSGPIRAVVGTYREHPKEIERDKYKDNALDSLGQSSSVNM